jgi:hypothetical protein
VFSLLVDGTGDVALWRPATHSTGMQSHMRPVQKTLNHICHDVRIEYCGIRMVIVLKNPRKPTQAPQASRLSMSVAHRI